MDTTWALPSLERTAALRKAMFAALQDPKLLADAHRLRLEINPVSGEDLQALVAKLYAAPAPIISRATDALIYRPPS